MSASQIRRPAKSSSCTRARRGSSARTPGTMPGPCPGEESACWSLLRRPRRREPPANMRRPDPTVSRPRFERRELVGNWPAGRARSGEAWPLRGAPPERPAVVAERRSPRHDRHHRLDRAVDSQKATIAPGGRSAVIEHGGDAGILVETGRLNVQLVDSEQAQTWFKLAPGDGFYLPEGARYRLFNVGRSPAMPCSGLHPPICRAERRRKEMRHAIGIDVGGTKDIRRDRGAGHLPSAAPA